MLSGSILYIEKPIIDNVHPDIKCNQIVALSDVVMSSPLVNNLRTFRGINVINMCGSVVFVECAVRMLSQQYKKIISLTRNKSSAVLSFGVIGVLNLNVMQLVK